MFKKTAFLTLVVLCNLGYLCAGQQTNNEITNRSVVISGRVIDKITAKPLANANVYFQAQGVFEKAFTNNNGIYYIHFNPSFWVRFGKIWVSTQEFQEGINFLVITPYNRTITANFRLLDIVKPYIAIYSPKENQEIFTNPTIRLQYHDYGSDINKASVRIFANNREITKYIKFADKQNAICAIPEKDPLGEGPTIISARISDFARNTAEETALVTVISKATSLIRSGKQALIKQDILSANIYFKDALRIAPANPEANFYYAVTRLGVLPLTDPVFNLLRDMGLTGPKGEPLGRQHLNPFNFKAFIPKAIKKFNLPVSFPNGQKFREVIENQFLPEMEQALAGLDLVLKHKDFVSWLEVQNPVSGTGRVKIDYADAVMLKSMIYTLKSRLHEMLVRNIDSDFSRLSDLFNAGALTPEYALKAYPSLLRVQELPQSIEARQALVLAIDNYLMAFYSIQAEADDQNEDLISISQVPKYSRETALFAQEISGIKKSLLSQPEANFSMKFSQLINLGRLYTNPPDIRRMIDDDGVSYLLQNNFLPHIEYTLNNLANANITYQEYLPMDNHFYKGKKKKVDFADVAIAKSGLESLRFAALSSSGYDLRANLQDIALKYNKEKRFNLNDILNANPGLFNLADISKIALAKDAIDKIVKDYKEAADYLLNHEDSYQSDDLLVPPDYFRTNEPKYRMMLEELNNMRETLIEPGLKITKGKFHINLREFFINYKDMRGFLPKFDKKNKVILGSWPDATFSGILPDNKILK